MLTDLERVITGACEADGRLVLVSLWERGPAVCDLPAATD